MRMPDRRLVSLIRLLQIGAVASLIMAAIFALMMATFATDAPGASKSIAALVGLGVFAVLGIPGGWLPWWAVGRIRDRGAKGLLPATVFAVLSLFVLFPLGFLLGLRMLLLIRQIMVKPEPP
jgi:hypothetical protein